MRATKRSAKWTIARGCAPCRIRSQWANQEVVFLRALQDMFPLAKTIVKGARLRDECRGAHYKPEWAMPEIKATEPAERRRQAEAWCRRFEENNRKWLKTTIATWAPDGQPQFSYEDVDTSLVEPRPRLYGLLGGEAIEEVWKERNTLAKSTVTRIKKKETVSTIAVLSFFSFILFPLLHRDNAMPDLSAGRTDPSRATFRVRVLRQDAPGRKSYWQRFEIEQEPDMNCISVLQRIAENPTTVEGHRVAPVVWECNCLEEVCGACTMLVNGRVRQACTALVVHLLRERPGEIELRPMTKFPVLRDLMVDRSRMFAILEKVLAWLPVDSYYDLGPGPRQSQEAQQLAYLYSKCMTCGCCLEACPQFLKIELPCEEGETPEALQCPAAGGQHAGLHGRACHRPGGAVQLESHRRDERRRTVGRADRPRGAFKCAAMRRTA